MDQPNPNNNEFNTNIAPPTFSGEGPESSTELNWEDQNPEFSESQGESEAYLREYQKAIELEERKIAELQKQKQAEIRKEEEMQYLANQQRKLNVEANILSNQEQQMKPTPPSLASAFITPQVQAPGGTIFVDSQAQIMNDIQQQNLAKQAQMVSPFTEFKSDNIIITPSFPQNQPSPFAKEMTPDLIKSSNLFTQNVTPRNTNFTTGAAQSPKFNYQNIGSEEHLAKLKASRLALEASYPPIPTSAPSSLMPSPLSSASKFPTSYLSAPLPSTANPNPIAFGPSTSSPGPVTPSLSTLPSYGSTGTTTPSFSGPPPSGFSSYSPSPSMAPSVPATTVTLPTVMSRPLAAFAPDPSLVSAAQKLASSPVATVQVATRGAQGPRPAMSVEERIRRVTVKEEKDKSSTPGSDKLAYDFAACIRYAQEWNKKTIVSKKGPDRIMRALKELTELKIELNMGGLSESRTLIKTGMFFVTNSKDAVRMITNGSAEDMTRSKLNFPTEIAAADLAGVNALVRDRYGNWGPSKVKEGDNILMGTGKSLRKLVGDTKFALRSFTEADINNRSDGVTPFGEDAFEFNVIFNLAMQRQKGKLNNYLMNEISRKFNPNWIIFLLQTQKFDDLRSVQGFSMAKLKVIVQFLMSKDCVARLGVKWRPITNRTQHLISSDPAIAKYQMDLAVYLKNTLGLNGLGDTTAVDDIKNGRARRKIREARFNF